MRRNIICLSKKISQNTFSKPLITSRFLSSKEAVERRNHLFNLEKKRQVESVGRLEKIEVQYRGIPKECTLIMNKDLSTPYDCARHLSQWHMETSALALLDGTVYWDMHRPLHENCTLELQNFQATEPHQINSAFWRTCSMLLGACATRAFRDTVAVKLHSFPGPNVRSGSFIYDIDLSLPSWAPTDQELRTLSAECVKLIGQDLKMERLEVNELLAMEMFVGDEHKSGQISSIASGNDGKVTLYRMGDHIDMSKGPMIANINQIGRIAVTAVHTLQGSADSPIRQLYRFQGVALPKGVILNHFAFSILMDRAKKLNPARSPIGAPHVKDERSKMSAIA